jgi:polar amino acid transport system substrate-binding protein
MAGAAALAAIASAASASGAPLHIVTDQGDTNHAAMVRTVVAAMGRTPEIERLPWPRALAMVMRGERDALFSAFHDAERAKLCHYPDEPLGYSRWLLFVRAADVGRLRFTALADLEGHRIGVQRGATLTPEFWDFLHRHGNYEEVSSDETSFRMLAAGRIDFVATTQSNGERLLPALGLAGQIVPLLTRNIREDGLYIIFNKQRIAPEFVARFSATLVALKQTEEFRQGRGPGLRSSS